MTRINVNADILCAVGAFVTPDKTRYYLNGVHVLPKPDPETGRGVLMISTDGHRLAAIHDPDGSTSGPVTVATDFKAKVLKTTPKDHNRQRRVTADINGDGSASNGTVLSCAQGEPGEGFTEGFVSLTTPGGTYPDFWRVIPTRAFDMSGVPEGFAVNPQYVLDVRTAIDRSGIQADGQLITLHQLSRGEPMLVLAGKMPSALFVIMPMRYVEPVMPFWMRSAVPEAAAA
jgi:hypothetical protein